MSMFNPVTFSEVHRLERQLESRRPNHILHLLLSLVTAGLWIPIWFLMSINDALERGRLERKLNQLTNKMLKGE